MKPGNDSRIPPEAWAGTNPAQWLAAKLAELRTSRALPPLRMPRRPRLTTLHRRRLAAMWDARLAVRAGVPIEEYLQHRLSRQLAALPVPPSRLPVSIEIAPDGAVCARPVDPAAARRAPWLESFLRAEGWSAVGPEMQLAQADVARLAARIESQRARANEVARDLEAAAQGREIADPGDDAQARQMGRPPVPAPIGLALRLFSLALLVAETWQLGIPCLEVAGIRTGHLATEFHRDAVGLAFAALFALGASVSLFLLAHLALRRAVAFVEAQREASRRAWTGAGALGAAALGAALAWSVAGVRPAAEAAGAGPPRTAIFLVAIAIPMTVAWLVALARRLDVARGEALALARAWDREHYRALADLSRRAAVAAEEDLRLERLEAERAAAVRRLRSLQQRAMAAERLAADAGDAEQAELERLAQAVVAALDLDRYEYLRQAGGHARRPAPHAAAATASAAESASDVERNLGLAG